MSLSSFFGIGGGSRPSTQQVIQTSKLPEEIAPFAKEVLEEAKALYEAQTDAGYKAYTGDTIASFTPEQQRAQRALAGLYGSSDQTFADVAKITEGLDEKFTGDIAQEYMSPYQQAVTDIEKRKAMEDYSSRIMPTFEKRAIDAGGMSGLGSRAAIEAAQLGGKQAERLGDIQAKGLQRAYADAQSQFAQQKERERMQAADMLKTQGVRRASDLQELGALSTVGEQKQALAQQALDEAYYKHLEKQAYPQEKLAEYSGFVYGNPLMSQRDVTKTSPMGQGPGLGSQLLGAGMTAGKLYAQGGGFGDGFSWAKMFGGAAGGGIASLPMVYREESGQVSSDGSGRGRRPSWREIMNKAARAKLHGENRAEAEKTQRALEDQFGIRGVMDDSNVVMDEAILQAMPRTALPVQPHIIRNNRDASQDTVYHKGDPRNPYVPTGQLADMDLLTDQGERKLFDPDYRPQPEGDKKKKDKPPVNPLRTVGGLREYMERMATEKDKLGRTQLRGRESFATTADKEREAAIADRASKMRGETRRRGGIFGEDFAPAAIQQLLAVTPPGSPRRGLLERVMLGASAGSQALTKAQDEREDVMRDIEEDAGTARISAKEQDLTARAANLTQKQKLDLNKLTNKFDLEKKLAELPAENAARIRKILLSDAEFRLKDAKIKKELALAEKALAEAGATNRLDLDEAVKVDKLLDNQDRALTGLGIYDGKAENADVQRLRARARQFAIKAFLDNNRNTNVLASTYIAAYKKLYGDYMGKKKPVD
tara:strand:+ start:559 stop:2859 length:2301 start_codon:yes stop_codon:yes gene_type:complete